MSVTSVTDLYMYNPQILFPSFKSASVTSVTSDTGFIFQRNKRYKCYSLHFPVLQGLQVLQHSFSSVTRVTSVTFFIFQCYKGDKS